MKLASVGKPGHERPAVVDGDAFLALDRLGAGWPSSWRGILDAGLYEEVTAAAGRAPAASWAPLAGERLGPPPDPSKVIAIGLNYRDHALEQKKEPPQAPLLFSKAPSCLIGPRDAIVLPKQEPRVDAEAELCVVIKRRAKGISVDEAPDVVLGWMVMNDVSGRAAQYGDKQFFRGKSFDTFGPSGPWIVTTDELPDPSNLAVECDWNGREMQRGNTRDLIFDVPTLVSYTSAQMTLLPGDLITTGTPAGVGVFRTPPVFLAPGDLVRVSVEGLGELLNPVT